MLAIMQLPLFIMLYFDILNAYYLSLTTLNWKQAEDYCQQRCNSHLASIHSDTEYEQLINLIKNATISNNVITSINAVTDTWIGLTDDNIKPEWAWIDGTDFDFGNDTNGGIYPWSKHDPGNDNWTVIEGTDVDGDYLWNDKPNEQIDNIFACNNCDGILTKYAMITKLGDHAMGQTICTDTYGTELASIHSNRDLLEIQTLHRLMNQQEAVISGFDGLHVDDCYIGLYYLGTAFNGEYSWDDGTDFDFAANYSSVLWENIPDVDSKRCACIDEGAFYLMSDAGCTYNRFSVCNLPSEICYGDRWEIVAGNGWSWTLNSCQMNNTVGEENIAMITDRIWLNEPDKGLVIEYMYQINEIDTNNTAKVDGGIILFLNTSCNHYYYVGISYTNNSVFLADIMDNEYNIIISKELNFKYMMKKFYLLQIELINGTLFKIGVNGVNYLNISHHDAFNNYRNEKSGYIGVRNTASSIIAKSLFISGRVSYQHNQNISTWFNQCTKISIPTTLTPNEDENGILVTIKFQYDIKATNINIPNILTNITVTIIDQQVQNYSVCINSEQYGINVTLNTTNNQSYAAITASVYVCNTEDKDRLIAIFDNHLDESFIDNSKEQNGLYVYPDTLDVDVDVIKSIITTTNVPSISITTTTLTKYENENGDKLFILNVLMVTIIIGLCFIICILIFCIRKRKKSKGKIDDKECVRVKSVGSVHIELEPGSVDIDVCSNSNNIINGNKDNLTPITPSNNGVTSDKLEECDNNMLDMNTNDQLINNDEEHSDTDDLYAEPAPDSPK